MKIDAQILAASELFGGMEEGELSQMLSCLGARVQTYKKGEQILSAGDKPEHVGVVLSGQLQIVREDLDGNRALIAALGEADLFAEALCCAGVEESPVTVLAGSDVRVLLIGFSRIVQSCPNTCAFHQRLISNMLRIVALKNLYLQGRLELIRTKSIREKVLSYLRGFAQRRGEAFAVPLNREEMADYLCVERSALSHELMRMRGDGLIQYSRNRFTLL